MCFVKFYLVALIKEDRSTDKPPELADRGETVRFPAAAAKNSD
jgi:hypothetical protein